MGSLSWWKNPGDERTNRWRNPTATIWLYHQLLRVRTVFSIIISHVNHCTAQHSTYFLGRCWLNGFNSVEFIRLGDWFDLRRPEWQVYNLSPRKNYELFSVELQNTQSIYSNCLASSSKVCGSRAPARVILAFSQSSSPLVWEGGCFFWGPPSAFSGLVSESFFIVFESEETDRLRKWRKNRLPGLYKLM